MVESRRHIVLQVRPTSIHVTQYLHPLPGSSSGSPGQDLCRSSFEGDLVEESVPNRTGTISAPRAGTPIAHGRHLGERCETWRGLVCCFHRAGTVVADRAGDLRSLCREDPGRRPARDTGQGDPRQDRTDLRVDGEMPRHSTYQWDFVMERRRLLQGWIWRVGALRFSVARSGGRLSSARSKRWETRTSSNRSLRQMAKSESVSIRELRQTTLNRPRVHPRHDRLRCSSSGSTGRPSISMRPWVEAGDLPTLKPVDEWKGRTAPCAPGQT